ncbi:WRKY transcription factor 68-like [Lolium rigidum]|uniref:WRKY transcription factor 68-like n=1 Tax=Lolium rigidum TaxID=89674 RepID=UPI001F5C83A4|nr:WRKY transcription factor 68-like [Lolium rigidum]
MHPMSGAGGGHGGGQLYGDRHPAAASVPLYDGDDNCFFQNSVDGGLTPPYASITDYLQGFLDPAGLATHLDAAPCVPAGDAVNRDSAAPNSSTSSEPHRGKKGRPEPEQEQEGDEQGEVDEDEEGSVDRQDCSDTKKKGKVEKKARGPRVAFATKSEVDHLDDGYRWRKYGQKAVKNSSFPRSYYRCTAARCGVKKQVERSQQDPSTVVTTYEGHHAHPSPAAHRGMASAGANSLYSMASLQQQRHGFCPSSPDNLFLAAAGAMAPAAAATSPATLLPRQAEHRFAEYYGMQLQDVLLDPSNQHGHR